MSIIENLSSPWVSALVWTLVHSLWQILLIAIVLKICLLLARKASAKIRHAFTVSAIILLPLVGFATFINQYMIYKNAQTIAYIEFPKMVSINMQENTHWFMVQKTIPGTLRFVENYTNEIFWIYLAGIFIITIIYTLSLLDVWKLKNRDVLKVPDTWQPVIDNMQEKFETYFRDKIALSALTSIPVVAGFFRPVILFPAAIAGSLSLDEVEHILLHELYHIKCKDHYINAIKFITEILFFYHPLTWWISSELKKERENRVDEWVVAHSNQPLQYANTLFKLEQKRNHNRLASVAASYSQTSLFTRIKNILHMKTRNIKPLEKSILTIIVFLAIGSLAWLNPPAFLVMADDQHPADQEHKKQTQWVSTEVNDHQNEHSENLMAVESSATEKTEKSVPEKIVMQDGKSIAWEELSEEDKQEIRNALKEASIALEKANKEMAEKFQSEEFRQQRKELDQTINKELKTALKESEKAMKETIQSGEFQKEMEKARQEIRKAMEQLDSEEFRQETHQAMKEVQKALKESQVEIQNEWKSEAFQQQMKEVEEEIKKALQDVNKELNSEELRQELKNIKYEMQISEEEWNKMWNDEDFQQDMQELSSTMGVMFEVLGEMDWAGLGENMGMLMETLAGMGNMMIDSVVETLDTLDTEQY
ncbi:MAG: M56 family metallopeptidase [Bacteroidota bacterium]